MWRGASATVKADAGVAGVWEATAAVLGDDVGGGIAALLACGGGVLPSALAATAVTRLRQAHAATLARVYSVMTAAGASAALALPPADALAYLTRDGWVVDAAAGTATPPAAAASAAAAVVAAAAGADGAADAKLLEALVSYATFLETDVPLELPAA